MGTQAWYLAQIRPNCLNKAILNLDRQKIEVFSPMLAAISSRPAPLFPGYIFVALDPNAGLWRRVNSTYGVARLVSFGDRPLPVPSDLITDLRSRCDKAGLLQVTQPEPIEAPPLGSQIRILEGPFRDFLGRVASVLPEERVMILLDFMGAAVRMTLSVRNLEPA